MCENNLWLFNRKNPQVPEEVNSEGKKILTEEDLFNTFVKDMTRIRKKFKNEAAYEQYLQVTRKNISTLSCDNCEDYERYHDKKDGWCAWCYNWKCLNFLKDQLESL